MKDKENIIKWLSKKATSDEDMYYVGVICRAIDLLEKNKQIYPPTKGVWGENCSNCGKLVGENGYSENYCSHCGVRIRGHYER